MTKEIGGICSECRFRVPIDLKGDIAPHQVHSVDKLPVRCWGGGKAPVDKDPEPDKCAACALLGEVFEEAPKTDHWTWAYVELFCMLHGDKDYCEVAQKRREIGRGGS